MMNAWAPTPQEAVKERIVADRLQQFDLHPWWKAQLNGPNTQLLVVPTHEEFAPQQVPEKDERLLNRPYGDSNMIHGLHGNASQRAS